MLLGSFVFSLLYNQKPMAIGCLLAYFLTVVGLRRSLPIKVALFGAGSTWIVAATVAPVIFSLRASDAKHKTDCYGCRLTECTRHQKKCILSITVDEVYDAVKGQLALVD
jgi:hypothetical protein